MAVIISANGQTIFTITDDMLNMFQYSISKAKLQAAIISFIQISLERHVTEYKTILQNDWLPQIKSRYTTMSTNDTTTANLIYSQPDYQDYDTRNPPVK